jgi:hypothetical protein
MKVISFSRCFPAKHPKKGEETLFVQKIFVSMWECGLISMSRVAELGRELNITGIQSINEIRKLDVKPKHHTIRAGHRWKEGDVFSPRYWSGKPYASKQICFVPWGMTVAKTWDFEVDENGVPSLNGRYCFDYDQPSDEEWATEKKVAANDGLLYQDWENWITQPCFDNGKAFHGQIICWNPEINY